MKLIKTREFLEERIKQNRESAIGRPLTDYSIKEVKDELHEAEMKIRVLYVSLIIQFITVIIFIYTTQLKTN